MIRPQYHFRRGPAGLMAWNVARLIREAASLPVTRVPIASLSEVDEAYWGGDRGGLSVREIAEHGRLIIEADPTVPILLCSEGRVMDGMHRVARCLVDGLGTVPSRRFDVTPEPDFYPADPDRLSYNPTDFRI